MPGNAQVTHGHLGGRNAGKNGKKPAKCPRRLLQRGKRARRAKDAANANAREDPSERWKSQDKKKFTQKWVFSLKHPPKGRRDVYRDSHTP